MSKTLFKTSQLSRRTRVHFPSCVQKWIMGWIYKHYKTAILSFISQFNTWIQLHNATKGNDAGIWTLNSPSKSRHPSRFPEVIVGIDPPAPPGNALNNVRSQKDGVVQLVPARSQVVGRVHRDAVLEGNLGRDSIALKNITKNITKIITKKLHIKKLQ